MMKRRIIAMILTGALALSLAACGGGNSGGTSDPGGSSAGGSAADASQSDGSTGGSVAITLNETAVTLKKAGATFRLRYTAEPDTDGIAVFTSKDPGVAAVSEDGTITAVAPGKTTVTVEYDGASAVCAVTCVWEDESASAGNTSKPAGNSSAANVDLQSFFDTTTGKYEFGMLSLADSDILDALYAGLNDISLEQMQVYYCPMSMNNGEFGLVQVADSKDVDAVTAIFQARVDYMVGDGNGPGGAQYPMAMDAWENNSRIVSNGNYIMMVVHENCDDIVSEFNALF